MKKASDARRAVGLVAVVFLLLTWFSPMQQALRTLPERITLREGEVRILQLGGHIHHIAPGQTGKAGLSVGGRELCLIPG